MGLLADGISNELVGNALNIIKKLHSRILTVIIINILSVVEG
jgi:hypothetical protein